MQPSVTKVFGPYPFAHRQWTHNGHCRHIHGHNWTFAITFSGPKSAKDENGFLIDFGKMKTLNKRFEEHFDHTFVTREDDPELNRFVNLQEKDILRLVVFPAASTEDLCPIIRRMTNEWLDENGYLGQGIYVRSVVIAETPTNSASAEFKHPDDRFDPNEE